MSGYRPHRDFDLWTVVLLVLFWGLGPALALTYLANGGTP